MGADQLDKAVLDSSLGDTVGVGSDVSEITDVADLVVGSTVGLSEGVEVGAGGRATVGVVAKLVDVHSALGVGVLVLNFVLNDGRSRLGLLRELDGAGNAGITAEDSNCETTSWVSELVFFSVCEGVWPAGCLCMADRRGAREGKRYKELAAAAGLV